jgi:hypothetical protein
MSRTIDFNDSFSSASAPNVNLIKAGALAVYANDAAYVSAKGSAAAEGDLYWNSTIDDIKFYTGTEWKRNESELNNSTTTDPTVNDDSDDGYEVLSLWLNTVSGDLFRCTDATVGAAVWSQIAADAELQLHIADTSTHGVTEILGSTEAQTASNKSIQTPSRLDCKQDTEVNLTTYAATATNGQFCFATDTKKYYQVLDSTLVEIGSGSGGGAGFDVYGTLDADTNDYTDFDTTNLTNATLGEESTSPLSGTKSYLLTNVTGSVGEYIISPAQTVQKRSNDKHNAILFPYRYDGADNDLKAIFYDETNSAVISEVNLEAASITKNITLDGYIPSTTTSVSLRIEVLVVNNGKKLIFDDIVFSDNPLVFKDFANLSDWTNAGTIALDATTTAPTKGTTAIDEIYYAQLGSLGYFTYDFKQTTAGTTGSGEYLYTLPNNLEFGDDVKLFSGTLTNSGVVDSNVNGFGQVFQRVAGTQNGQTGYIVPYSTTQFRVMLFNPGVATQPMGSAWFAYSDSALEYHIEFTTQIKNWTATTEHYVTPANAGSQHYTIKQAQNAMSNLTGPFEFNLATATITNTGTEILTASSRATDSSTIWTAGRSCIVDVDVTIAPTTAGMYLQWYKNGAQISDGGQVYVNTGYQSGSWQFELDKGDFLAIATNGTLNNSGSIAYVAMTARPREATFLAAIPQPQALKYETNAGQSVANAATTIVDFEDKKFDNSGNVTIGAAWKFTATEAGIYNVSAIATMDGTATSWDEGEIATLQLWKNGAIESTLGGKEAEASPAAQINVYMSGSTLVEMAVGDYIDLRVYQSTGSARNLISDADYNNVSIHKIGF